MFLLFLVGFFCFFSIIVNNFVIWWSIFLFITLIFLIINKSSIRYVSLFNYFILQERLGLLFLLFFFGFSQYIILIFKVGVSPLHFWLFGVVNYLRGFRFVWFLTFQKLPFLVVMIQIYWFNSFLLLFFGILFCIFQIFFFKSYKKLFLISSVERFNWVIIMMTFSFFNVFFLLFFYFIIIFFLIGNFSLLDNNYLGWETILIFLNIPFGLGFLIKIFSIDLMVLFSGLMVLILLVFIFLSFISFSFWLINLRTKFNLFNSINNVNFMYLYLPLMILLIF